MKDFKDKVAVITGAASGIGRALADKCFKEGMKIVLADIEEAELLKAETEIRAMGADVLAVLTDVSKANDVENLAENTIEKFGAVHLLFNNAGVGIEGPLWENTIKDYQWVLGVNLWGVIHGIRTFIPIMTRQDTECHIVNTSSALGLISGAGIYGITKHAIMSLTESLATELKVHKIKNINVSVLCPFVINTKIPDSERNRPKDLENDEPLDPEVETAREEVRKKSLANFAKGMAPETVANIVFQDIRKNKLHIFTDTLAKGPFELRVKKIMRAIEARSKE